MSSFHLLPAVALLAAAIPAQATRVLPDGFGFAGNAGGSGMRAPVGEFYGRTMQVFDPGALGFATASVTELAFRRDSVNGLDYTPRDRHFVVRMGTTDYGTRTLPDRFSAVPNAATTEVFAGNLSVPSAPDVRPALPAWSLLLPFRAPWTYQASAGQLLIDVEGESRVIADGAWGIDAYLRPTDDVRGSGRTVGRPCAWSGGEGAYLWARGLRGPVPGEPLLLFVQGPLPPAATVAVTWLGTRRAQPLDLTPIGAPTCTLWVDPIATAAFAMRRYGGDLRQAEGTFPTPPDARLNGLVIAAQAAVPLAAANAAGLLFTDATELTFGNRGARTYASQTNYTVNVKTDLAERLPDEYGAVLRLRGSFQ